MKGKIILITILLNIIFFVYGEAIRNYSQIEAHKIKVGNGYGELGVDPKRAQMAAPTGPTTFTLNNDVIYVCDYINARINVYDSNWNFLNSIKDIAYTGIYYSTKIKLDDIGNILVFDQNMSLLKIDRTGKLLLKIPKNKYLSDNFIPYHDKLLLYSINDKKKREIIIFDENGKILDKDQTLEIVNNTKTKALSRTSNFESDDIIKDKVKKIFDDKGVIIDKAPLTDYFSILREYYEMLKGAQLKSLTNRSNNQKEIKDVAEYEFPKLVSIYPDYIGFDADGNSYWQNEIKDSRPRKDIILVCSPYGEILDVFYNPSSWNKVAIAPNGDVYFLSYDKEWVYFHKVTRRW